MAAETGGARAGGGGGKDRLPEDAGGEEGQGGEASATTATPTAIAAARDSEQAATARVSEDSRPTETRRRRARQLRSPMSISSIWFGCVFPLSPFVLTVFIILYCTENYPPSRACLQYICALLFQAFPVSSIPNKYISGYKTCHSDIIMLLFRLFLFSVLFFLLLALPFLLALVLHLFVLCPFLGLLRLRLRRRRRLPLSGGRRGGRARGGGG